MLYGSVRRELQWHDLNPTNCLEIIQKEAASKRIFTRRSLSMSNEIPSVGSPQLLGWISRSDPLKERRAKQLNSLRHSIPDHPNSHLIIIMYLFDINTKTKSTTTSICKTIKLFTTQHPGPSQPPSHHHHVFVWHKHKDNINNKKMQNN